MTHKVNICLLTLIICLLQLIINGENIIINTKLGQIEGTVHKISGQQTVYSFKGIQYGISPIGSLRFRPSSINESKRNNIYNATIFGPTCIQPGLFNENQPQSEDCLFLNIWTPKKLTAEEEKLLTQLKKSKNFNPNPGKTEKGFFDRVRDFMS